VLFPELEVPFRKMIDGSGCVMTPSLTSPVTSGQPKMTSL